MRLAWLNRADAAVLSADSELSTLPASNVQNPHIARKWHTAPGVKATRRVCDMREAVECAVRALLGTNLTAAATLQLRASDTDPAALGALAYDSGVIAAGVKAGYGAAYKAFNAVSARYWGLDIADASLPDNVQIGRLFLGPCWHCSVPQSYDWSVTALDESRLSESWGGQTHADERPQRRVLQFALEWMDEAEMYTNAFAMARANGVVRDVLAIPDIGGAYLAEQAVFGLLTASEPLVRRRLRIFRQKFTVKERL
jgi:hypothetical protein